MLKQKMFLMDDHVFEEGDKEDRFQVQYNLDDQEDVSAAIIMGGLEA